MFAKFALDAKFVSDAWTIAAEFGSIAGLAGIGVFQKEVDAYSWPGSGTGGGVGVGVGEGEGVGVEVAVGVGVGLGVEVVVGLGQRWRNALQPGFKGCGAANTPEPRSMADATTTVETKPKRA